MRIPVLIALALAGCAASDRPSGTTSASTGGSSGAGSSGTTGGGVGPQIIAPACLDDGGSAELGWLDNPAPRYELSLTQSAYAFPDGGGEAASVGFSAGYQDGSSGPSASAVGSGCTRLTGAATFLPEHPSSGAIIVSDGESSIGAGADTDGGVAVGTAIIDGPPLVYGPLIATASGGDFPPFSLTLPRPRIAWLTSPLLDASADGFTMSRSGGLEFDWTGAECDERVVVLLSWIGTGGGNTLRCDAPGNAGRLIVPGALVPVGHLNVEIGTERQVTATVNGVTVVFRAMTDLSTPNGYGVSRLALDAQ